MNNREIEILTDLIEMYKVEVDALLYNIAMAIEARNRLRENQELQELLLQQLYPVASSIIQEFSDIPITVSEEIVEDNEPEG